MSDNPFGDADAQNIRTHWFNYLDRLEAVRAPLHAYCVRLTQNIWDAEDLVQETMLRGFAMTARGDLHGDNSRVRNAKAYLFRTATNFWLDQQRHRQHVHAHITANIAANGTAETTATQAEDDHLETAVTKAMSLSSPQEFAALVLKDGYDFSLAEVAEFIGSTTGTVKSALSRARRKMVNEDTQIAVDAQARETAQAFVSAINDHDLERVKSLMAETLTITVCNVGGGRGRDGVWSEKSIPATKARYAELDGEGIIILEHAATGVAHDVLRINVDDGVLTRITDYCYAPETLSYVGKKLNMAVNTKGYHQPAEVIKSMVETTGLPWNDGTA